MPLDLGLDPASNRQVGVGWASVREGLCNLTLAALYGFFAYAHLASALERRNWLETLPIVIQEALLVVLFLTRRRSERTSQRLAEWILAIAATFLPLGLRMSDLPGPYREWGQLLQIGGLLSAVFSVLSLGRSIGIVPANRGIRVSGAYRWVRHPLYTSHAIAYCGYGLSFPSSQNLFLIGATLACFVIRAGQEERLLSHDPAYASYRLRVRWRFVPFVY